MKSLASLFQRLDVRLTGCDEETSSAILQKVKVNREKRRKSEGGVAFFDLTDEISSSAVSSIMSADSSVDEVFSSSSKASAPASRRGARRKIRS